MVNLSPLDLEALLAPLDERQPAGVFDEEDSAFQDIDHEMVKLGSLQETSLNWGFVDEAAQLYLTQHCKHFRILGHLVSARVREPDWRRWADAAGALVGMVEGYWESGYPKPGPTGLLHKKRLVSVMVERLGEALPKLKGDALAKADQEAAQKALDRLQACAEATKLDVPMLTRLESQFTRRVEETRYPAAASAGPNLGSQGGSAIINEAYFTPELPIAGNERENKRTLLAIADYINQQNAYDPTGYLLRRFALWAHLTVAPVARREQRTELMGVPTDQVEIYQEALATNQLSPALVQRVEKSVTSSPYWLRGSFLTAAIAQRLEMAEVAEAIRLTAERFVLRIPALKNLQFSDGRAFVDAETLAWLGRVDQQAALSSEGREYAGLREELGAVMERDGVEMLLHRLEQFNGEAQDARHHCHVMTIGADLLARRGFPWLSDGLYQLAFKLMQETVIPVWEPVLFNHLAKQVGDAQAPVTQGHTG